MAGAADFKQLKFEQEEKKAEVEASKIARGGSVYFLCMALVAMYVWILRQRSNKEHVAKKVETLGRASLEGKFDLVQVSFQNLDGLIIFIDKRRRRILNR